MKHLVSTLVICCLVGPAEAQAPVEKDHAEKMARGTEIFKKHIRQVLLNQCLKCHGGETTEAELDNMFKPVREKPLGDAYLKYLFTELKPAIDARYRTLSDRAHTSIIV